MSERVFLSGATGYIAGHTIERLLAAGYDVVASVRDPGREESVRHLTTLDGAAGRLTLVQADLNTAGVFDAYVADVDYVLHMASPYIVHVRDPERDLLMPAVRGTLSILEACAKSSSVRRVVVTSSMAAITDEPDSAHTLTEDDWNEKSSLQRNPYYFSKTRAERAAWEFMDEHKPDWSLIAINPFLVIGPSLTARINASPRVFADILNGKFPAIMALAWGLVDVRDVAQAHVAAMTSDKASGRYVCAADVRTMRAVVSLLREAGFAQGKLPKMSFESRLGTGVAWLSSYLQPRGVGSYLRTHLGRTPSFDNSKIRRDLGIEFRDVDQSIVDTANDLAKWGHVRAPQQGPAS